MDLNLNKINHKKIEYKNKNTIDKKEEDFKFIFNEKSYDNDEERNNKYNNKKQKKIN